MPSILSRQSPAHCLAVLVATLILTVAGSADTLRAADTDAVTPPSSDAAVTVAAVPAARSDEAPPVTGTAAERIAATAKLAIDARLQSRKALTLALRDEESMVRRHAIYGLQRLGYTDSASDIVPLLKDPDEWVRRTAAVALGRLPYVDPDDCPCHQAERDRQAALSRGAAEALVGVLDSPDYHLRYEALISLGRIGQPFTQKAILKALRNQSLWSELDVWDQVALVHVLERPFFTDTDGADVLKWLLHWNEWDHPELKELSDASRESRALLITNAAAVALAMKYIDEAGVPQLLKGLEGDDYMQQTSARAVGKLLCKEAVPGLIKLTGSEWTTNKRYAIEALSHIGGPEAVATLEKLASDPNLTVRMAAAAGLKKIDGKEHPVAVDPPAETPTIDPADLGTPGGKRPPQFICLGVDDCVNIEGLEAILDICETLRSHGSQAVFTLWVAPLASNYQSRDLEKQKLIYQRLFDLGCEFANHTLHHNPGGKWWGSLPREQQVEEIEGAAKWYRDNIAGFTRPFTYKGGGGSSGSTVDRQFTGELLARQNFLYYGRRGKHPDLQLWPTKPEPGRPWIIDTGCLDAAAPPVHKTITDPIHSDYAGTFDFSVPVGVTMWKANFQYHYAHPRRPILAVNAFHDWGFKTQDDSTAKWSHQNEGAILKEFLLDVLVRQKDKYPDTYCVTYRQVIEYCATDGDLQHTLLSGNCQDSRNPVKPTIP